MELREPVCASLALGSVQARCHTQATASCNAGALALMVPDMSHFLLLMAVGCGGTEWARAARYASVRRLRVPRRLHSAPERG